jgi:MFS family permease
MVGEEKMGIALGITESFMLLGRMIGPIVAGIVWSFIGISAPFWLGGLINLIALIPLGFSLKVERFNKTHPL